MLMVSLFGRPFQKLTVAKFERATKICVRLPILYPKYLPNAATCNRPISVDALAGLIA